MSIVTANIWRVMKITMKPEFKFFPVRIYDDAQLVDVYHSRYFQIETVREDLVQTPSLVQILGRLYDFGVDGEPKKFHLPQLDPPPPGASNDLTKDIPETLGAIAWDWEIKSIRRDYDLKTNLHRTYVSLSGKWSYWCFLGRITLTEKV